jgi:OmpA-OmpF porin, OOP family
MNIRPIGVFCFLLFVTSALAQPYAGANVGTSWVDDICDSTVSALCDDHSSSFGGYLGYRFWDHFAVEFGIDNLGKFTGDGYHNGQFINALTLVPKVSFSINDSIDFYGKLGAASVDYGDGDDVSVLGAIGFELGTDKQLSVRLEYQALTDVNNEAVRSQINTTTLGFVYKFGSMNGHSLMAEENHQLAMVPEKPENIDKRLMGKEEKAKITPKPIPASPPTHMYKEIYSSLSFATDSAELSVTYRDELESFVKLLNAYPQARIILTGHADNRGTKEHNLKLSKMRANKVADTLIKGGVAASRITVIAMGEEEPIASNETQEGKEENRLVEIEIPSFEY